LLRGGGAKDAFVGKSRRKGRRSRGAKNWGGRQEPEEKVKMRGQSGAKKTLRWGLKGDGEKEVRMSNYSQQEK